MPSINIIPPIPIKEVRYIKLGRGGEWAKECIDKKILRIDFETHHFLEACRAGKWDELRKVWSDVPPHLATQKVNQVRAFFEDEGTTLWITFHARDLWWTVLDSKFPAEIAENGRGTFRQLAVPWTNQSVKRVQLRMDTLSGNLTKLAAFPGASCNFSDPDYVLRRINGERSVEVIQAEKSAAEFRITVLAMLKRLDPSDFELLVDLVFSRSGWRRLSAVGGAQKTIDMEIELPTTGDRAFVQVKSRTTQQEFEIYRNELCDMNLESVNGNRMFYVFHSGDVCFDPEQNKNISVIDGLKFSQWVMDAGLVSWLMLRVA